MTLSADSSDNEEVPEKAQKIKVVGKRSFADD